MFKLALGSLMVVASLAADASSGEDSNCGGGTTCVDCEALTGCGWYQSSVIGKESTCNDKTNPDWGAAAAANEKLWTLAATCPDCDHNNCNKCLEEAGCRYYDNMLGVAFKCQKGDLNDAESLLMTEKKECDACEQSGCSECQAETGCKWLEAKSLNLLGDKCKKEPNAADTALWDVTEVGECSSAGSLQMSMGLIAALMVAGVSF